MLEEDPCFNAGRGSVLAYDGGMSNSTRRSWTVATARCGAVAGLRDDPRSDQPRPGGDGAKPARPAELEGADEFACEAGLEQVPNRWFETAERRAPARRGTRRGGGQFDADVKYGTIGAVAVDSHGHVAAATSTGGLTAKRWGRIGDSPLIGAGTYADDRSAAVSRDGLGRIFHPRRRRT